MPLFNVRQEVAEAIDRSCYYGDNPVIAPSAHVAFGDVHHAILPHVSALTWSAVDGVNGFRIVIASEIADFLRTEQ